MPAPAHRGLLHPALDRCCCCAAPLPSLSPSSRVHQGDSTQRWVKDLDVVLGNEAAALVMDDTEGVWPRHRDNLLAVERYVYFPACAARFGLG